MLLNDAEIAAELKTLTGWTTDGKSIQCILHFADFPAVIAFVNRLVEPSEAINHHPDLAINWKQIVVTMTNHDAGGLTAKDFAHARTIASLV